MQRCFQQHNQGQETDLRLPLDYGIIFYWPFNIVFDLNVAEFYLIYFIAFSVIAIKSASGSDYNGCRPFVVYIDEKA